MADKIQMRRDTAARWQQFNPILMEGEIGLVLDDPNQYKIGDGVHAWNSLPLRGFNGNIVQETGDDENAVMSQKVVTEKLSELGDRLTTDVGYVNCESSPSIDVKSIEVEGLAELTTNLRLLVRMKSGNFVDNVTLNINSLGARPLYYNDARASSTNTWKSGEVLDIYYDGENFRSSNFLGGTGSAAVGNMILEWNTDVATTRKQVSEDDRKAGMQISYLHPDNGWTNEQYIGTKFYNTEWEKDDNWAPFLSANDMQNLTEQVQQAVDSANGAAYNADQKATAAQEQAGYAREQGDYAKEMGDYVSSKLEGTTFLDITEIITAVLSGSSETAVTDGFYESLGKAFVAKATVGTVMQEGTALNFPMTIQSYSDGSYEMDILINQMFFSGTIGGKATYVALVVNVGSDKQATITKIHIPVTGTGDGTKYLADDGTYKTVNVDKEMYVIDGRLFSGDSGTISAEDWEDMKGILEKAATDANSPGKLPTVQVLLYMLFATIPAVVTKDSDGYSMLYSDISSTYYDKYVVVTVGRISITESGESVTYEMKSTNVNLGSISHDIETVKTELEEKADKVTVVDHGTDDTTFELTPNVLHRWGEVASLTLTLGAETPGVVNEYMFQFTSGAVATQLSLPETVKWTSTPEIAANTVYQVSIVDNLAVMGGWSNE